jgi:isocitrate dehydrogenase
LIPDRCYAGIYQEMISYVKTKGQFDVATMGNVSNVGLMAQKAEGKNFHIKLAS